MRVFHTARINFRFSHCLRKSKWRGIEDTETQYQYSCENLPLYCELTCSLCGKRNPEPLVNYQAIKPLSNSQCTGLPADLNAIPEQTESPARGSEPKASGSGPFPEGLRVRAKGLRAYLFFRNKKLRIRKISKS